MKSVHSLSSRPTPCWAKRPQPQPPLRIVGHPAHVDRGPTAAGFVGGKQARPFVLGRLFEKSRGRTNHDPGANGDLEDCLVLAQGLVQSRHRLHRAARVFKQTLVSGQVDCFATAERVHFHPRRQRRHEVQFIALQREQPAIEYQQHFVLAGCQGFHGCAGRAFHGGPPTVDEPGQAIGRPGQNGLRLQHCNASGRTGWQPVAVNSRRTSCLKVPTR